MVGWARRAALRISTPHSQVSTYLPDGLGNPAMGGNCPRPNHVPMFLAPDQLLLYRLAPDRLFMYVLLPPMQARPYARCVAAGLVGASYAASSVDDINLTRLDVTEDLRRGRARACGAGVRFGAGIAEGSRRAREGAVRKLGSYGHGHRARRRESARPLPSARDVHQRKARLGWAPHVEVVVDVVEADDGLVHRDGRHRKPLLSHKLPHALERGLRSLRCQRRPNRRGGCCSPRWNLLLRLLLLGAGLKARVEELRVSAGQERRVPVCGWSLYKHKGSYSLGRAITALRVSQPGCASPGHVEPWWQASAGPWLKGGAQTHARSAGHLPRRSRPPTHVVKHLCRGDTSVLPLSAALLVLAQLPGQLVSKQVDGRVHVVRVMAHPDHLLVLTVGRHYSDVRLPASMLRVVQSPVLDLEVHVDGMQVLFVPLQLRGRAARLSSLIRKAGCGSAQVPIHIGVSRTCLPSFSSVAVRSAGVRGTLL
eukprot:scaffold17815_cov112-Isochrysis_galbana.AAC.11